MSFVLLRLVQSFATPTYTAGFSALGVTAIAGLERAAQPCHVEQIGNIIQWPLRPAMILFLASRAAMMGVSDMIVAGLFAGIGGLEVGLAKAGHEAALLCEASATARAVLSIRFPQAPCYHDVRTLPALPDDTELLTAGFPCQDLSQAGLTAGIQGSRSSLVGRVFALVDQQPVPWVLLENVSFMLQLDGGRALATLVEAFEERGYLWAYRVVNSLAFLPQRRERVLFLATRTGASPADVLMVDDVAPPVRHTTIDTEAHGFYWTEGIRGLGWAADAIPTLKNGSTIGIPSPPAILMPDGRVITPDIRDAERLQGFAADWTAPAERVSPASNRWSLVGNAVTTHVAEWLGGRLASPGRYDCARDSPLETGKRWPRAARFDGGRRYAAATGAFPVWRQRPSLVDFLHYPGKPLSARATRGFLARTERGSLRFVKGFKDRLRDHLHAMETTGAPSNLFAVAAE